MPITAEGSKPSNIEKFHQLQSIGERKAAAPLLELDEECGETGLQVRVNDLNGWVKCCLDFLPQITSL